MSDLMFHHCCQTFPQFPIGYGGNPAKVTNPQLNIKPPNSAILEPNKSSADPDAVADFVDLTGIMFVPVSDVKVVLQLAGDERKRQWLSFTYDMIETIGAHRGNIEVPAEVLQRAWMEQKIQEHLNGPRPSSCNTNKNSDRLVTPTLEEEPIVKVPNQQKMLISEVDFADGRDIACTRREVLMFDGCGAHTTLGYLRPEFGHIYRKMFDAAIALLPEGSHFVMGAKVNHQVLPTASVAQAHSYMIDINRVFMPDEFRLAHWVGEFLPFF